MATKQYDVVVKGDPKANKLLDCPFCHRVLLTLEAKQLGYDKTYVDFDNKPDWLVQQSGGKVPLLRKPAEPSFSLPDSDAIVQYLEKEHPTPSMTDTMDNPHGPPSVGAKLFPSFRGYLFSEAGSPDESEKRAALEEELTAINAELSKPGKGPLFGGQKLNALDAAMAPRLYHTEVALAHFKGYNIPDKLQAVKEYLGYIKQLPEWKATDYGTDAIIAGWTKHMQHK